MTSPYGRVLIVDGDFESRHLIRLFLSDRLEVSDVSSGEEALAFLEQEQPDLVLLELRLPDMNGIELLERLREVSPDTGVIILSSLEEPETVNQVYQAGAEAFVRKPFEPTRLQRTVERVLERAHLRGRLRQLQAPAAGHGIWSFCRATGGVGQTTLLLAIAQELVDLGRSVVVVDLELLFGHVALYLGIHRVTPCLFELHDAGEAILDEQLLGRLHTHGRNLKVVTGPEDPEVVVDLRPEVLVATVLRLAAVADHVLIDMPVGVPERFIPLLEDSANLFVVTTDRPGPLQSMRVLCRTLASLQDSGVCLRPVMNGWRKDMENVHAFFRMLDGIDVTSSHVVPFDEVACREAIRMGQPLTAIAPETPLATVIRGLVGPLVGTPPRQPPGGEGKKRPDTLPSILRKLIGWD